MVGMPDELDPYHIKYTERSLHQLAYDGDNDTISQWLAVGGDPNIRDGSGQTLLHAAVRGGHLELVKLLLARSADANACSDEFPYHTYPAQIASYDGALEILDELVKYGADLNIQTQNGCTLIHLAVFGEEIAVMQYLLDREADVDIPAEDNVTPLASATMHGYVEATRLLLDAGADPNAEYAWGLTPLSQVSEPEIARMLIAHGADVNYIGRSGITPIFHAGSLEVLEILLAHGARIDIIDLNGNTLLHQAMDAMVMSDYDEVIKCIVHHPLDEAIRIAELFVEQGLDINARNRYHKTPLAIARKEKNAEMVTWLTAHGGID